MRHNLEKRLQNQILHTFGRLFPVYRQNVGVSQRGDHVIRFGQPGEADLWGILPGGIHVEIEVKSPDGKQSDDQRRWESQVTRAGGIYVLARSVQDVWDAIGRHLRPGDMPKVRCGVRPPPRRERLADGGG